MKLEINMKLQIWEASNKYFQPKIQRLNKNMLDYCHYLNKYLEKEITQATAVSEAKFRLKNNNQLLS